MGFTGKVVFISGASSGIGAATAIEFVKEGANVAIVGRNEIKINKVSAECEQFGSKPLAIIADLSKEEEAVAAMERTIECFGKLDILVNNAGILRHRSVLNIRILEIYDEIMNTNLRAVIHQTSLAAPHLIKTKGSIVNISSVAGCYVVSDPGFLIYSVSKAGVNHFTRGVALELASYGVRVNSFSPGPVETDIFKSAGQPDFLDNIKTALGRISEPIEIAQLVLYLSSEKAKAITGSNYVSDNGYLLVN